MGILFQFFLKNHDNESYSLFRFFKLSGLCNKLLV